MAVSSHIPVQIPASAWLILGLTLAFCLAVDIFLHRGERADSPLRASLFIAGWVTAAVVFGIGMAFFIGREVAKEFAAAYLLQESLSVDNIFVFLIIFKSLLIPPSSQRKVLSWGILGAFVLQGIFIGVGAAAIHRWRWILYVFGGVLIITGLRLLKEGRGDESEHGALLNFLKKHLPVTSQLQGTQFWARIDGRRLATPLFLSLVAIELSDIVFAFDSAPAAFSISTQPFVVFSASMFATLCLRSLYGVLSTALSNLRHLHLGLAAVLIFAGGKMLVSHWIEIGTGISLLVILGCIVGAVALSLVPPKPGPKG